MPCVVLIRRGINGSRKLAGFWIPGNKQIFFSFSIIFK